MQNANSLPVRTFLAGLFLLWTRLGFSAPPATNVILITIDTLRADHLGCYGYSLVRTPNIDRLAQAGARFTRAYTPVPITMPAHAALFTGAFPLGTGVHDFSSKLPPDAATLAQTLRH